MSPIQRMASSLLVLVAAFTLCPSPTEAQSCRTPSGGAGNCILIDDCEPIKRLLVQRPLPPSVSNLLRRSQCGFSGNLPKICCPNTGGGGTVTVNELLGGNNGGGSTGVPVSQGNPDAHPNRRLLNTDRCGGGVTDRIIGGEEAGIRDYPWLALLQYQTNRGRQFLCGGALISSRYVMTAAHCVRGIGNTRLVGVRLGEHNLNTDPDCQQTNSGPVCGNAVQDFGIGEVIPHQQYRAESSSKLHDIALIRLDREVSFTDFIMPICLPAGASVSKRYEGSRLIVAGWGKTENSSSSNIKLWVQIPVMSNQQCAPIYQRQLQLNANQMCAGGQKGKDSCRGDSGGPLMSFDESVVTGRPGTQWVSVGIVSIGPAVCGAEGRPGIYTRVGPYVNWILDQLKP